MNQPLDSMLVVGTYIQYGVLALSGVLVALILVLCTHSQTGMLVIRMY